MPRKHQKLKAEDMPSAFIAPDLELPEGTPNHHWRGHVMAQHMQYFPLRDSEGRKEFFTKWEKFYGKWRNPQPHMVEWLIKTGRVYYNPGKPIVVEKDGAQVLIYAQDLAEGSREFLKEKMLNAIKFSGPLSNYKALNALMAMSSSGGFYPNTMGALFLRLTELTALHAPINEKSGRARTFLDLCEEHGFELGQGETVNKEKLKTKLNRVLKAAGIARLTETRELLKDWMTKDIVTIQGQIQLEAQGFYSANANAYLKGYDAKYHDFNKLISASYAVADEVTRLFKEQPKKLQPLISNYLAARRYHEPQIFNALLKRGEQIQMQDLAEKIKIECKDIKPRKLSVAGQRFFRKMLNGISYESVEIIGFSGYGIVYAPMQDNIDGIYPGNKGEAVLGYEAASCDITRKGSGVYIPKVKTLLVADGEARHFWKAPDIYSKLCMTIMHESVHIGLSNPRVLRVIGYSGEVSERGFHQKGMLIADIDEFLRDACAELETLTEAEQEKYTNWGTLLDTTLKLKQMFNPKPPTRYSEEEEKWVKIYSYDDEEWMKELICNWHAMSARGGQYAKGMMADNIFHGSGNEDAEPGQLKIFRTGTMAVRSLMGEVASLCKDDSQYKIPGVTCPLEKGIKKAA